MAIFQQLRRATSPRLLTDELVKYAKGDEQFGIGQRPHKQQGHLFHLGKGGNCYRGEHGE